MKVMISQPRYLPHPMYLRRIKQADLLILMDDTQRVERGYENRNKMQVSPTSYQWLTVPVADSARTPINQARILPYTQEHIRKIESWYKLKQWPEAMKAHFAQEQVESYYQELYNRLMAAMSYYQIDTPVIAQSSLGSFSQKGKELIMEIASKAGASDYLAGVSCYDYGINESFCKGYGIELVVDKYEREIEQGSGDMCGWLHYELIGAGNMVQGYLS